MSNKDTLTSIVSKRNLLQHPFYQAWSNGTLPMQALQTYAREYGVFIGMLPRAWEAMNDSDTAAEEREHAELWDDFAAALDTRVSGSAETPEIQGLAATAHRLFRDPATAAGALYAFEVQQPATASSKLDGLRTHYNLPQTVEPYFEIHSHNEHEAAKLLARIDGLPCADQSRSLDACAEMAESLWNALSGIYGKENMSSC
jgi:pyrroloquinoline-quinone synthase